MHPWNGLGPRPVSVAGPPCLPFPAGSNGTNVPRITPTRKPLGIQPLPPGIPIPLSNHEYNPAIHGFGLADPPYEISRALAWNWDMV